MAIRAINISFKQDTFLKQKSAKEPYLSAEGNITTEDRVKPLPAEGHLIHDTILTGPKYFFKDMLYDAKAVKDGFLGKANDHQLGRLNDVGLKLGGVGIATYLASRTTDPKKRLMEYIGLGTFLTSMAIYPKIAINKPAKLVHGYDIDKQYIDDQGRKKSVFQDSNYIPFDMYRGEAEGEDLDEIGDKLGIARDIKNRHDLIREQMRKIATQNNTLWMLTAGFATPAMTALICYGIENYVATPALQKVRNSEYDKKIAKMLEITGNMNINSSEIQENNLSKKVGAILDSYKGKELPKEEFDNLINLFTEKVDDHTGKGIIADITNILQNSASEGGKSVVISDKVLDDMIANAKSKLPIRGNCRSSEEEKKALRKRFEDAIVPTKEEIISIIKKVDSNVDVNNGNMSLEKLAEVRQELSELISRKVAQQEGWVDAEKIFAQNISNNLVLDLTGFAEKNASRYVSEDASKLIKDFAKTIGEFKANNVDLDACKSFKVEKAPETILANYYGKFERTVLDILDISNKDLKSISESETFARDLIDKKLSELCKDASKYEKAISKLSKIMEDMVKALDGEANDKSSLKDLINAIENNYNNTAKRLHGIDEKSFSKTIEALVNEDVSTLHHSVTSKEDVNDLLNGIRNNKYSELCSKSAELTEEEYIKEVFNGKGSSKNAEITRLVERFQGVKNSFNRLLLTLDVYKRTENIDEVAKFLSNKNYRELAESVAKDGRDFVANATASEFTQKFKLDNNPMYFKDLMNGILQTEKVTVAENTPKTGKGILSPATENAMGKESKIAEELKFFIAKLKNLVGNSSIDFTKLSHLMDSKEYAKYTQADRTRMTFFNLVGQSPLDMIRGASDRKYGTNKWLKIVAGVTGLTFGVAILSQFAFGKIRNPHNIQKQVKNESN